MSGPRDTFRKTRCLELVLWTVLPLVLAFPAFTSAQNMSEQQENLPAQPDTTCTREGGCSAVDFPNSITYDDSQTPPEAGATNRSMQSQPPPEAGATNRSLQSQPPGMSEQEQNRNQGVGQYPNQNMPSGPLQTEPSARQGQRPRETVELTDFQQLIASSVGDVLPIYGANLFRNVPTTFAPVDHISIPADYVIGPGDQILVRGWGQLSLNVRAKVDRSGSIFIPEVGNFYVAGLKYDQLQPFLKAQVGRVFQNFELSVSLGELRSIDVFVMGQARRPGRYTISSLSTITNAIFVSGGPSPAGSMRRIQLKRGSQVVVEFDLYDLLLKGDKSKDALLSPGDVIFIPPVGPQIAVSGRVHVPAIFELKTETDLAEALRLAGGLSETALGDKVWIERIDQRHSRRIEEVSLDYNGMSHLMKHGDLVTVDSVSPKFENSVTLRGNVARPGRYVWHQDMRVSDLIPDRDFLLTRDYWKQQNQVVYKAKVEGTRGETLQTDVKQNAPEINWDYAVVQRTDPVTLSTKLLPFNLAQALLHHDNDNDLLLKAGDIITIFSQADLEVPKAERTKFIRLEGEFKAAGLYLVEPGQRLHDLIEKAGGFAPDAYLYAGVFTRESVRVVQQERLEMMVASMQRDIFRQSAAMSLTAKTPDEALAAKNALETQRAALDQLRLLKPDGRIVLDLPPAVHSADEIPNLALEDGDRFFVPSRPAVVSVIGDVYNQGAFLQRNGKTVSAYLQNAGGPTVNADKSREFIYRANGTVISKTTTSHLWTGGFDTLRLQAGDTVVVPEQTNKGAFLRSFKDWSQILANFGLAAAAINVLK
jgi:polysaccharide biosynthesis/export protein